MKSSTGANRRERKVVDRDDARIHCVVTVMITGEGVIPRIHVRPFPVMFATLASLSWGRHTRNCGAAGAAGWRSMASQSVQGDLSPYMALILLCAVRVSIAFMIEYSAQSHFRQCNKARAIDSDPTFQML